MKPAERHGYKRMINSMLDERERPATEEQLSQLEAMLAAEEHAMENFDGTGTQRASRQHIIDGLRRRVERMRRALGCCSCPCDCTSKSYGKPKCWSCYVEIKDLGEEKHVRKVKVMRALLTHCSSCGGTLVFGSTGVCCAACGRVHMEVDDA